MSKMIDWFKNLPMAVRVAAPTCAGILLIGIIIIVCILSSGNDGKNEDFLKKETESTQRENVSETLWEPSSEYTEVEATVPYFAACYITTESVKNDLTIYVEDENGNNIKERAFAFKLLDEENFKEVKNSVEQIHEINTEIAKLKDLEGTKKYSTEDYKNLLIEKKVAVDAYAEELGLVQSESYIDDDSDGTITITNVDGGDYYLCYIPTDEYDVEEYGQKVTVRSSLSYKPIETIEKRMVASAEAGDSEPDHSKIKVEGSRKDTVKYMDSVALEESSDYSDWMNVDLNIKASVSGEMNESVADTSRIAISKDAVIYAAEEENAAEIVDVTENVDALQLVPDDTLKDILNIDNTDNGYEISVQDPDEVENTITGILTLGGVSTAGTAIQVQCSVQIIGSSTKLQNAEGTQLYIQNENKKIVKATVGSYKSGQKYCVAQKSNSLTYYGWQTENGKQYYYDNNGKKVTGKQVINGISYTFDAKGRLQKTGYGVDVSSWQGGIDWKQAATVVDFAMIRCGFRGTSGKLAEDARAIANVKEARKNGLKAGLYFYSRAKTEAQAMEEASVAIRTAKTAGKLDLPIYIAMEDSALSGLSTSQRDAIVQAFCRTVKNSGYEAGVYASKDWLDKKLTPSSYSGIAIWCVQYNTSCTFEGKYAIWQFTAKGNIPGITGSVNLNKR